MNTAFFAYFAFLVKQVAALCPKAWAQALMLELANPQHFAAAHSLAQMKAIDQDTVCFPAAA